MITEFITCGSLPELLVTRNRLANSCVLIAGGTELNRLGSPVAEKELAYVSLSGLGLDQIQFKDDGLYIGSMVTLQQLLDAEEVPLWLKEAVKGAGSRTLRNMATIGGNIGSFRDDSYLLPSLIAAKSRILTADVDEQGALIEEDVPIREYTEHASAFNGSCITQIVIKRLDRIVLTKRYARTVQRRPDAIISFGAACDGSALADIRIAVGALGTGVARLKEVEEGILTGSLTTQEEILQVVKKTTSVTDDITGSAAYRQYLVSVTIADMLARCKQIAEGGTCT